MSSTEKQNTYTTTNTYSTLNVLGPQTKNVWIVFHGIGYLSRYFINFFDTLPENENYIIAPQAPSKYYLNGQYKHVGASWLTREKTDIEIENVLNNIDSVFQKENVTDAMNLIVFGFSQGVSIAARWVAKRKIECNKLVLYAGGLPNELNTKDFNFLWKNKTEVIVIIGDADEYLTPERMESENQKIKILFEGRVRKISFVGGHEVKKELITDLVN
mgnify:CR=1 FL=1